MYININYIIYVARPCSLFGFIFVPFKELSSSLLRGVVGDEFMVWRNGSTTGDARILDSAKLWSGGRTNEESLCCRRLRDACIPPGPSFGAHRDDKHNDSALRADLPENEGTTDSY